jgi:hypothetical protein
MSSRLSGMAMSVLLCSVPAAGQEIAPFVIPTDPMPGSLITLPPQPPIATDAARIQARDGHFYLGRDRFRVWGVNLCFGANFPTHAEAERLAARLAGGGVNSVRFHHMDSTAFPRGIWDPKDLTRLSSAALDRLDYLLDQLARRGLYANLNLHVSRTHSQVLGLPDTSAAGGYDKIVDLFTPDLIDAQRRYARDLLTHVNAYRGVRYADDPAVAFVEISNEDSLFMWGAEQRLRNLPPFYADILGRQYVTWLKRRYGATERLREAWSTGAAPLGKNLLAGFDQYRGDRPARGPWVLEQHADCRMRAAPVSSLTGAVRIEVLKNDATDWHLQLNQPGLAIKGGQFYTLSFRARADEVRPIVASVGQAHEPYQGLGAGQVVRLTREWQAFSAGFTATDDDANARVSFILGASTAAVELAEVALRTGGRHGLAEGESLESGVALFGRTECAARAADRMRFLAEAEKSFWDGMRTYVKKDLRCGALVTGTIAFGPLGLYGQSGMDYIDGHAYWQHPRFPGRPWDPNDWLVEQKAMTDSPAQSPLFALACERIAGKPYTVSEYNHPAPNDFQAECVPLISAFAAAQDWDGVWLFAYSHRTGDLDRRAFEGFFDIDHNPAKWGFMVPGAVIFRDAGLGALSDSRVISLAGVADPLDDLIALHQRHDRNMAAVVREKAGVAWTELLRTRVAVALGGAVISPDSRPAPSPEAVSLTWRGAASGAHGAFEARGAQAVVQVGALRAAPGAPGAGPAPAFRIDTPAFAACALVSLDGLPLDKSARMLAAACGRCENTGMQFLPDRRTVGRNWGRPPVRIETVAGVLIGAPSEGVLVPLDATGRRAGGGVSGAASRTGVAELTPAAGTMWYLLLPRETAP